MYFLKYRFFQKLKLFFWIEKKIEVDYVLKKCLVLVHLSLNDFSWSVKCTKTHMCQKKSKRKLAFTFKIHLG